MLSKPWKYKEEWLVWPNSAIDNMDYNRVDCEDTINGVCYYNIPIEECIDKSTDGFGYHVQFKNGNSLCAPLRTSIYSDINVVYKLVNQKVHSELNDVSVSTFVNTKKYEFPPLRSDIFFYFDIFLLKNSETGLILSDKDLNDNRIDFSTENNNNINIQIIPKYIAVKNLTSYRNVLYGTDFSIIIEGTSLFLTFDNLTDNFKWIQSSVDEIKAFFKIMPLKMDGTYDETKLNNPVGYNDEFTIFYSDIIVLKLNSDNILSGEYNSIKKMIERNDMSVKSTFSAISKMTGYYCDDDICKPVQLSDINKSSYLGGETIYNNSTVGRNKDCWGACKYWDKKTNSIPLYSTVKPNAYNLISKNKSIVLISVMIILLAILLLYFTLRRR